MSGRRIRATAALGLTLAPIALPQALWLRSRATRLPEAPGERAGVHAGRDPALHIVAVGESPLAAVGLPNQASALTPVLAGLLAEQTGRCVHWRTAARGGVTAAAVRHTLLPDLAPGPCSLILIGLGVNDSIALRSATRWRGDLCALIKAIRQRCGPAPVLLAGVPGMQHFPVLPRPLNWLLGSRARLLDHVAHELASAHPDVAHVPMQLDGRMQHLFCQDGFHPNAEGHALWAEQLLPTALALIQR